MNCSCITCMAIWEKTMNSMDSEWELQLIFEHRDVAARAEKNSQLIAEQCALRRQLEAIHVPMFRILLRRSDTFPKWALTQLTMPTYPPVCKGPEEGWPTVEHVTKGAFCIWSSVSEFNPTYPLSLSDSLTFFLGTSLSLSLTSSLFHLSLTVASKENFSCPNYRCLSNLRLAQFLVPLYDFCFWINLCKHTCCHLRVQLLSLRLLLHRLASQVYSTSTHLSQTYTRMRVMPRPMPMSCKHLS